MTEKEFLKRFEDLSLPPEEFNHRGHLWLGWLYIRNHELGKASHKLNTGIRAFAESLGASSKFHFTLTIAFACAIKSRFIENQSFEEFLAQNEDLQKNPMLLIETHYIPEVLHSQKAKVQLVPPDRKPFPEAFE